MESRTKLLVMDDRGTLRYGPGAIEFRGRLHRVASDSLDEVRLVRPAFPFLGFLIATIIGLGIGGTFILLVDPGVLAIYLPVFVLAIIPGLVINRKQRFVRVTGTDRQGQPFTAHFHVASNMGWSGIVGGNTRLAKGIRE